jgi:hypothetical protein
VDVMRGGFVTVDETRAIADLIRRHRNSDVPFDIVQFRPIDDSGTTDDVRRYEEAGATWWIESASPASTFASVETRIRKGPIAA